MQEEQKKALYFCLIISPIMFVVGFRIGGLCSPSNYFGTILSAFDNFLNFGATFTISEYTWYTGFAFVVAVWLFWLAAYGTPKPEMAGEEHGSSRWAKPKEIKNFANNESPDDNLVLSNTARLATKRKGFSLHYDRNLNVAVIGGSGSGKTRYYVKPNLMQLHGNYFVTDPKGTVVSEAGPMLKQNGYEIVEFNVIPDTMSRSKCFNPLYYVKTEEQILAFVNCLISNTEDKDKKGGDAFWTKSEQLLYVSIICMMKDWMSEEDYNLPSVLGFIDVAKAKEEDEDYESPLDALFNEIRTGYMSVPADDRKVTRFRELTGQIEPQKRRYGSFNNSRKHIKINEHKTIQENEQEVVFADEDNNSLVDTRNVSVNNDKEEVEDTKAKVKEYWDCTKINKQLKPKEDRVWIPSDLKRHGKEDSAWDIFVKSGGKTYPEERKNEFCCNRYDEFKSAAGKTLKSIIISCNARLMPIAIPEVTRILSGKVEREYDILANGEIKVTKEKQTNICEMELDKLGDPNTKKAIFAVMSDTNSTYFFLVALMMYQVIDTLCNKALTDFNGKLPTFVHFIFDEFANLGVLADFERTIAITRSRNIGISIILQTPSQLKTSYEENAASTILENCDTTVYLGGGKDAADKSTCKDISAMLGKKTIHTKTFNVTKSQQGSTQYNYAVQQRDLMLPDEVGRLPRDEELVIIKNTYPFKDKKCKLEKMKRYSQLVD